MITVLETQRLVLRELVQSDLDFVRLPADDAGFLPVHQHAHVGCCELRNFHEQAFALAETRPDSRTEADAAAVERQALLRPVAETDLRQRAAVFMRAGGIFASINHDTYDPHENVAYSVAFRTLLLASRVLKDEAIREFAYEKCLRGLDQFKMAEDRNGVATKGLLYMEKSWDTSYLWENAEAALAYFEAAADTRGNPQSGSREYELDGLVILRACARHHIGPHGFLTEGVDWNNHVGQQHHVGKAKYGPINYTEPFLNNQHIAEPTLYYLEHLASKAAKDGDPPG